MEQTLALNLLDPEFRKNPYPLLARLRDEDPVHRVKWGAWAITRHADVMAVLRDKRMSRDMRNWSAYEKKATWKQHPEIAYLSGLYMMNTDAPNHTRLRSLMAHAFTPSSVAAMRPTVERIADELLDEVRPGEPFEFMHDFALPLPLKVICGLFDFPYDDYPSLRRWSEAFAPFVEMTVTPAQKDAMHEAGMEFFGYLREFIAERRKKPGQGLVDRLISARVDGEKLSEDELLMNIAGMLFAGHETTTNQIGNGMLALLRFPEQQQKLRAQPQLLPSAAREFLRYDGSSNIVVRVATEALEIGGKTIAAGDVIMCMLGSANRDPAAFTDPERLDVARDEVPHTTYGGGRHHCIGAQLANMEIEVAFQKVLARFSRFEVDETRLEWLDRVNLRGLKQFVITGY